MKVKLTRNTVVGGNTAKKGKVVDVDKATATILIQSGSGKLMETATTNPKENTSK